MVLKRIYPGQNPFSTAKAMAGEAHGTAGARLLYKWLPPWSSAATQEQPRRGRELWPLLYTHVVPLVRRSSALGSTERGPTSPPLSQSVKYWN